MTKQDLFTLLQNKLLAIDGKPFQSVERWKNQVIDKARTGLPGCFIEFIFNAITQVSGQGGVKQLESGEYVQTIIQNLTLQVNIHVYDKTYEDNRTFSKIYELEQLVYLALQGKQLAEGMTPLTRIGGSEEDQLSPIDNCMVSFETIITDDSQLSGKTVIETTEKPIITRGTV